MKLTILCGDVYDKIRLVSDESIDLCITSPPYWGLRDYGVDGQLGCEPTMEKYLDNMIKWVKEIYRVLKPNGSFVLNIGDCFIGGGRGLTYNSNIYKRNLQPQDSILSSKNAKKLGGIYKEKQFLSVSSFAYCKIISETDFICRGEHIWCKPNVPSPIRCRLKHSHEKLFWFVKDADNYYFDEKAWLKEVKSNTINRIKYLININQFRTCGEDKISREKVVLKEKNNTYNKDRSITPMERECGMANAETIEHSWRVVPVGEKQNGFEMYGKTISSHVAPFPSLLIVPYIKSLCPPNGVVLDPFLGSGTTMRVAMENNRSCIGIELNKDYVEYTKKRVNWGTGLNIIYELN